MNRQSIWLSLWLAVVTYTQDIAPILNAHCIECHSFGADLNLAHYPFVSVFTEDQPAIVERILIRAGSPTPTMPPGNRPKLAPGEADVIRQWRDQGMTP